MKTTGNHGGRARGPASRGDADIRTHEREPVVQGSPTFGDREGESRGDLSCPVMTGRATFTRDHALLPDVAPRQGLDVGAVATERPWRVSRAGDHRREP
jgi:hypothetical protein